MLRERSIVSHSVSLGQLMYGVNQYLALRDLDSFNDNEDQFGGPLQSRNGEILGDISQLSLKGDSSCTPIL